MIFGCDLARESSAICARILLDLLRIYDCDFGANLAGFVANLGVAISWIL